MNHFHQYHSLLQSPQQQPLLKAAPTKGKRTHINKTMANMPPAGTSPLLLIRAFCMLQVPPTQPNTGLDVRTPWSIGQNKCLYPSLYSRTLIDFCAMCIRFERRSWHLMQPLTYSHQPWPFLVLILHHGKCVCSSWQHHAEPPLPTQVMCCTCAPCSSG